MAAIAALTVQNTQGVPGFETVSPDMVRDDIRIDAVKSGMLGTAGIVAAVSEAVAARLPCFWVYRDVGRAIHAEAEPDNPYRAWIDTYAGEDFDAAVEAACALADRLAESANAAERPRMRTAFARSTLLEWMFWDSAWNLRAWPDPTAGPSARVMTGRIHPIYRSLGMYRQVRAASSGVRPDLESGRAIASHIADPTRTTLTSPYRRMTMRLGYHRVAIS